MKPNSSADRWLHRALLGKDFEGLRSALSEGADPNSYGLCTEQSNRAYSLAHYAVKQMLAKKFLAALLDAGASMAPVAPPRSGAYYGSARIMSGCLLDVAVKANNMAAFEMIIDHPRFIEVIPDQPSKGQWVLLFDTQKPHLWLSRYLAKWGSPKDETILELLLKTALERGDRRCLSLLIDQKMTLSHYLAMPKVREGCVNSQGARALFDLMLERDQEALLKFKHETGKSLLATLLINHKMRKGSLDQWLVLPEIAQTLQDPQEQEDLVLACMVGRYKLKLLPHLIRVGIKMPSVRAGENCTDYFMRLGFNESERVQTPADVIEHGNLVNALWMQAQADTMSNALEDLRPSWSAKLRTRL